MANYIFPDLNGSELIINPTITKEGFAGGCFKDNESLGVFKAGIKLVNSGGDWWTELEGDTLPVDFSTEEIDIWIATELEQYEV